MPYKLRVVSTWHNTERHQLDALSHNIDDLDRAECVIVVAHLTVSYEGAPPLVGMRVCPPMRETYVEIGRALAASKPVIVIFGDRSADFLSLRDPRVSTVPTVELAALAAMRS